MVLFLMPKHYDQLPASDLQSMALANLRHIEVKAGMYDGKNEQVTSLEECLAELTRRAILARTNTAQRDMYRG